ncbi:hypothetical protein LCGC14_3166850, partial [marine sediment metagenome]
PGFGQVVKGGEDFILILKQDATGGRQFTFDSRYKGTDSIAFDLRPNRYVIVRVYVEDASNFFIENSRGGAL